MQGYIEVELPSEIQERNLTPTDVGKRLSPPVNARIVNARLETLGFQIGHRDGKGRKYWEPTELGKKMSVYLDTGKKHGDGTPVQQLKWKDGVLKFLNGEK